MTNRLLTLSHPDATAIETLVQDAVAEAQLDGWTIQSVIRDPASADFRYDIQTSRLPVLDLVSRA